MTTTLNDYAKGKQKNMTKAMYEPRKGETLTIDKIAPITYRDKDGHDEEKLRVHWVEDRPPLVLNKTNLKFILGQFGGTEKDFAGRKVIVWHDPSVELGGQLVGGLKLALPKGAQPAIQVEDGPDDNIPF